MAGDFKNWLFNFMQGRYGFDLYGQALISAAVVAFIVCIVCNLLGMYVASVFMIVSNIANLIGLVLIVYLFFRILSRNIVARRAENERYMARHAKRFQQRANGAGAKERWYERIRNQRSYKYLTCPHCNQRMRVPRGKGKVAVRCPKCGEKTIITS